MFNLSRGFEITRTLILSINIISYIIVILLKLYCARIGQHDLIIN
jgi:hypothetical protein